ncbi:hypothetical protein [Belliella pelovolcani]|uniref:Collagen triple helix repeat-containing protein n=1 Tax=Belliella pelovolcani TaxID=529505 RepID=A0A1N7M8V5_9BACT|nr:hypothetical protein [Belliella pelovolcani]SIS82545.1 hypothetical protein SAMN05421761_105205 [Belliella pelovolcani]
MKNLFKAVMMLGIFAFFACEGPPGPPGIPGQDGIVIVGEVFEIGNVNFTSANNFQSDYYEFTVPIEPGDKLLAYILWDVVDDTDVWRALPQTNFEFPQFGIFMYNYDFTRFDFSFFMDGNFDLSALPSEFTRNQVFRVVVFPADLANARMDFSDFNNVMEYMGKTEKDIVQLQPRQ